jgi:hypothetical protein
LNDSPHAGKAFELAMKGEETKQQEAKAQVE